MTALPEAASVLPLGSNGMDDVDPPIVDGKDKRIQELEVQNHNLLLKVSELEAIIEGLKTKDENLDQQIQDLTKSNATLKEQLEVSSQRRTRGPTIIGSAANSANTATTNDTAAKEEKQQDKQQKEDEPSARKKAPSLPPPPVPPKPSSHSPLLSSSYSSLPVLPSSTSSSSCPPTSSSPDHAPSPLQTSSSSEDVSALANSEFSTKKGSGWSTGTVERRRDSGVGKSRSSILFSQGSPLSLFTPPSPTPLSSSTSSSPSSPSPSPSSFSPLSFGADKPLDLTRRAKTAPIPAPSPPLAHPHLARAVSLPSAFTDRRPIFSLLNHSERIKSPKIDPELDQSVEEEENSPDLILAKHEETGKTFVKGGTLDKLIERLTYDKSVETDYAIAFLLTYRSFTTPMELLEKLIGRYTLDPKDGLSTEVLANFEKKKKIIQLRVGNVIKMWIDKHFHDFANDSELTVKVTTFVEQQILHDMEAIGKSILKLFKNSKAAPVLSWSSDPPASIIPKTSDFADFDPLEVARQLTLIEYDIYKSISSKECLNQAWNKLDKEEKSPNIVAMIKRFNLVSTWVSSEIVKTEKLTERARKVKKFLNIAKCCREIGNFNCIMEILAGLQNSAIFRLKKTWERVFLKAKYEELYNNLLNLMSNNFSFKDYRAALHSCQPPCIPYLGVYLTDLTFIEDGTKNTLNGRDDLIHFEKRRKVSLVIRDIQQYQQQPYHFNVEHTIKEFLLKIEGSIQEEKDLYNNSLACEPRESKDPPKREFSIPSFFNK